MTTLTLLMVLSSGNVGLAQEPPPKITVKREPVKPDMVIKWNEVALQAIRKDRSPPPLAARNLAIMHLAMYDAVMAIAPSHQPYLIEVVPTPTALPEAAVAAAAHRALIALYPGQREGLDKAIALCWEEIPKSEAREQGGALGRFVAERMLEARRDDASGRAEGEFKHKLAPGMWRPTPPGMREPLLPEWGYVKPFAIRKGTQYRPANPPALTSDAYARAFAEVKRLGSTKSATRTEEQTLIAHFWADDLGTVTPPGHWNRIAQSIAHGKGTSLAENARIFAHLNISLADAGVLCWIIKFTFELWRPITAIRHADQDGNPDTEKDESWTSLLPTPPFPAYTSGHSTFSAAAAAVLAQSFGTDKVRFSTASDELPGVTRSFDSLWAAAEEAGMSRIYGGIHWQFDNTEGLKVGRTLGEYVYRHTLPPRTRQVLRPPTFTPPPIIIRD